MIIWVRSGSSNEADKPETVKQSAERRSRIIAGGAKEGLHSGRLQTDGEVWSGREKKVSKVNWVNKMGFSEW